MKAATMKQLRLGHQTEILDPDLPIVDAHHHIWHRPIAKYMLDEWLSDINAGHRILGSVYVEAGAFYRSTGPEALRPLGEIEFANGIGAIADSAFYGECRFCAGLVARAELDRDPASFADYLDQAIALAPCRLRGVRQVTLDYPDDRPFRTMPHMHRSKVLEHPNYLHNLKVLAARDLVYDAAVFAPSLPRIALAADQVPDLRIVLNHIGMPVGIGMSQADRAEGFRVWKADLRALADRPNVFCKIGGLGMTVFGFGFEHWDREVGYLDLAQVWRPYVEAAVEAFGSGRVLMESNYPPDGMSGGYVPIWNAYKHILQGHDRPAREAMFARNAAWVYRLDIPSL